MTKKVILLLGLLTAGFILYSVFSTKKSGDILSDPETNPDIQLQPQQRFPMQISVTPRADDADQPWYTGSRSFMGSSSTALIEPEGGGLVSYDTSDMWNQLSAMYH